MKQSINLRTTNVVAPPTQRSAQFWTLFGGLIAGLIGVLVIYPLVGDWAFGWFISWTVGELAH